MQRADRYSIIHFALSIAVLNNAGVYQMNKGCFEEAATSFRAALSAMKGIDETDLKAIDQPTVHMYRNVQVQQNEDSSLSDSSLTKVVSMSLNEAQSINLMDVSDFECQGVFSIRIDTNDFEFFDVSTTDLLCSIIMYNMAVTHQLSSCYTAPEIQILNLRGCQKITELALHIIDTRLCSNEKDFSIHFVSLTTSGLIHSTLSLIFNKLGELESSILAQQRCQSLIKKAVAIRTWEQLIFGQGLKKESAAAA